MTVIGTNIATTNPDEVAAHGGVICSTRPGYTVYVEKELAPAGTLVVLPAKDLGSGEVGLWRCIENVMSPLPVDLDADEKARVLYGSMFTFKKWVSYSSVFDATGDPKHFFAGDRGGPKGVFS